MVKGNKYIDRLIKEWVEHGKIIVSIDYDSTIKKWHTIDNEEDIDRVISLIKTVQRYTYNVIFTASNTERHPEIQEYCESIGIRVDSINKNVISLPYGDEGKIYYNINLCDRSGLTEALYILETAYYNYIGLLQSKKSTDEFG
jgi:hypothetical protein